MCLSTCMTSGMCSENLPGKNGGESGQTRISVRPLGIYTHKHSVDMAIFFLLLGMLTLSACWKLEC